MNISRLSVSQITTNNWGFQEAVSNYASHGIKNMGVWTHKIEDLKPVQVKQILDDHGMKAANLCFGGLFTSSDPQEREAAVENTKKTLDLSKEIGADFLLVVSGPATPQDLKGSIDRVVRSLDILVPFAETLGAKIALEAIHPIDITRWTVLVTVEQVFDIVERYSSPALCMLLDLYNSWWEPDLEEKIPRIIPKILAVHLADWAQETLAVDSRVLPGQGVIPLQHLIDQIEAAGYKGIYDVEIFNEKIWSSDQNQAIYDIVNWFKNLEI